MKKNEPLRELPCHSLKKILLIMRIAVILLLFGFLQTRANSAFSQKTKFSINFLNTELVNVLDQIENETNFLFLYNEKLIDVNRKVSINAQNQEIEEVLKLLFTDSDVKYSILDRKIILSLSEKVGTSPQTKKVTGKVTDSSGQPLPGVSVVVKGTTTGTITDFDGNYSLANVPADATLVFSFVGMKTQEIAVGSKPTINVTMEEDAVGIEEVVAIGYGTVKRSDLTGAVSSVKADNLIKTTDASIAQLLKGKAAGVLIESRNAMPGGGIDIIIRGAASTGAGNAPLYIIDGFPVTNSSLEPGNSSRYSQGDRNQLNGINPNDIESIEILKDASATAIYGTRAANGVILITTKRGAKGLKVEYDANYSLQRIEKPFDMLNATEYMQMKNTIGKDMWMFENKIYPLGGVDPATSSLSYQPYYTEEQIANAGEGTDWFDLVTRTGVVNNHNLSFTAGNDKVKTFASFGYFNNKGVLEKTSFQRYSGKFNIDWNINEYIKAGVSYTGSKVFNENAQIGDGEWESSGMIMAALLFDPTLPVRDESGNYTSLPDYANVPNPVSFKEVNDQTNQYRNLINIFGEISPVDNLSVRFSLGYDGQNAIRKAYFPKTFLYGLQKIGQASIGQSNRDDYLMNITAKYNFKIKNHQFDILGGYEYQEFNGESISMSATNFFTDAFSYNNIGAGIDIPQVGSSKGKTVLASYFGRINYNLKDRYLITLTTRYDGSDKFGENNKWGFFPSAAIGWRITEEQFMKQFDNISNLKLRLSWGQTGNSNIGDNAFSFYSVNRSYIFNNSEVVGVTLSQLENTELRWETTEEINVGLDFGLFKNRISGAIEYYSKQIKDLLGNRNLKPWMLVPDVAANLGITQSQGVEITLNTKNIDRKLKWYTDFTYTHFKDRWKERSPDVVLSPWQSVDDPIRSIFGYKTDGIIQIGEFVSTQPNSVPGMMKVKDFNGFDADLNYIGEPDGKIDQADMMLLGTSDPGFSLGINNRFEYNNFDLTIYGYGVFDRLTFNEQLIKYLNGSYRLVEHGTNMRTEALDIWTTENTSGKYPGPNNSGIAGNNAWVYEDASYFRIKNITLGYSLPKTFLNKAISSMRLYFDVQNAIVFTKWRGMDPETDGSSKAPYPNQRSYTFGLNVKF